MRETPTLEMSFELAVKGNSFFQVQATVCCIIVYKGHQQQIHISRHDDEYGLAS
jgi:hypothetical protein